MFKLTALLVLVLVAACFKFATLAKILGHGNETPGSHLISASAANVAAPAETQQVPAVPPDTTTTSRSVPNQIQPNESVTTPPPPPPATTTVSTTATTTTSRPKPPAGSPEATQNPNEAPASASTTTGVPNPTSSAPATLLPPTPAPTPPPPPPPTSTRPDKPQDSSSNNNNNNAHGRPDLDAGNPSTELSILFYSVFIVYVSFVKLIYHNIQLINHNLTEQGILMIFGILWQFVARKISSDYASFPRFNSRIFFYLFLPSTVLESASLLPNKWLFFNLLPILTHSIIGTLMYASSMGFTIFALARSHVFTQDWIASSSDAASNGLGDLVKLVEPSSSQQAASSPPADLVSIMEQSGGGGSGGSGGGSSANDANAEQLPTNDLTLAECLIFGTILSSIDSAPMLTVFKQYRVNDKLYYLVLGENLMNNAVVITIFNSLLALFGTTKLTVFRVYLATLQFFANLVGAVFIGFALALVALVSVRLTKRFQLPNVLLSYQNQCQAMVETLLIFKLAYLTYTLANLAGTSSIVGLVTFGILNDQYVKHNLNLRSQLAFRQVLLGMKTMGFSLVYPLLGMLLVDTALSQGEILAASSQRPATDSQGASQRSSSSASSAPASPSALLAAEHDTRQARLFYEPLEQRPSHSAASVAAAGQSWSSTIHSDLALVAGEQSNSPTAPKRFSGQLAAASGGGGGSNSSSQATFNWYVKFLSIIILLTIIYRFLIVISLGLVGNVLTCGQLKIKIKEQFLMAYGGFKGPLSMALMHSFIENDTQRGRNLRNKHLFKSTVLVNILISAVLAGTLIRPLVARIQTTLVGSGVVGPNATTVFDRINYKLTEYLSHGLNSILGHSRSPYDRFMEFNETHIKPWLVRSGSNTNWLSVFYDNLILDETLNANCFHIVQDDPTTMRTAARNAVGQLGGKQHQLHPTARDRPRNQRRPTTRDRRSVGGGRWRGVWGRRSSSVSILNTIDEKPTTVTKGALNQAGNRETGGGGGGGGVSVISGGSSQFSVQAKHLAGMRSSRAHEQEALREFVMLNLKLENAKRRRRQQRGQFGPGQADEAAQRSDLSLSSPANGPAGPSFGWRKRNETNNSNDNNDIYYNNHISSSANMTDSSQDRLSRRIHLETLESRLGAGSLGIEMEPRRVSQANTRPGSSRQQRLATGWHDTFDLERPRAPGTRRVRRPPNDANNHRASQQTRGEPAS